MNSSVARVARVAVRVDSAVVKAPVKVVSAALAAEPAGSAVALADSADKEASAVWVAVRAGSAVVLVASVVAREGSAMVREDLVVLADSGVREMPAVVREDSVVLVVVPEGSALKVDSEVLSVVLKDNLDNLEELVLVALAVSSAVASVVSQHLPTASLAKAAPLEQVSLPLALRSCQMELQLLQLEPMEEDSAQESAARHQQRWGMEVAVHRQPPQQRLDLDSVPVLLPLLRHHLKVQTAALWDSVGK